MFKKALKIFLGDKQARDMKRIMPMVDEVNEVFAEYEKLSDEELQNKTSEFRRLLKAVPRVTRVNETEITHDLAENFLRRHPDVEDAVFLGTRRDYHPGGLVCFVRLKETAKASEDLAGQIRQGMTRMSPDHQPEKVVFIDSFPRDESGKRIDYHRMMRVIEEANLDVWQDTTWDELAGKLKGGDEEEITIDDIVPEAFAAVKEACRRHCGKEWTAAGAEIKWNMVPFDVQIAGGISLHEGNISEMATGEGKTLVAIMPLFLNGLTARGAHLVTVNDYLARRDSEWNGPIFNFLGLSVGCIDKSQPHTPERRAAYQCDITYGTNNEFGFDYLRDNMAQDKSQLVQREHMYVIIDEVDSILIDEARTPLIIAGPVDRSNQQYEQILPQVRNLVSKQQLLVSRFAKEAQELLDEDPDSWEAGYKLLQCYKGMPKHNRYMKLREEPANQKLQDRVERELMLEKKIRVLEDDLYFVVEERNRQIDLTDKGRLEMSPDDPDYFILPDLVDQLAQIEQHRETTDKEAIEKQKLEARENYEHKAETLHSLSQLLHAYVLKRRDVDYVVEDGKVVIVDENTGRKMPGRRWSDGLHGAVEAKEGVKIEKETQTLATITIQNYFRLYKKLCGMTGTAETEASEFNHTYGMDVIVIPTNVPTQRKDMNDIVYRTKREKYAAVLEEIKRLHDMQLPILVGTTSVAVSETVSRMLRTRKIEHNVLNAKNHAREAEIVAHAGQPGAITIATNMAGRGTDIKLGEGVRDERTDSEGRKWPGGLQIVGTERHESRRIDRQLRGRSGRQGDPGTSRFFVSLEDDLMLWFGSERISKWMGTLGIEEGEPIEHKLVTGAIGNAQKKVEGINQERRKRTLEFDDVMNKQRETIYKLRRELLVEEDLREVMLDVFADAIEGVFKAEYGDPKDTNSWDLEGFYDWMARILFMEDLSELREKRFASFEDLLQETMTYVVEAFQEKAEALGPGMTNALSRHIALRTLDSEWQDHLLAIDSLREGIFLRSYGQKDPLVEFTHDATDMFSDLLLTVHREVFDRFFRAQVLTEEEQRKRAEEAMRQRMQYQKAQAQAPALALSQAQQQEAADEGEAQPAQAGGKKPRLRKEHTGLSTFRRDYPKVGRNEPCPCGSGKKYKECHGSPALRQSRTHQVPSDAPPEGQ